MENEKRERQAGDGVTPTDLANVPDIYAGSYVISLGLFSAEKYPLDSKLLWDTNSPEVWLIQDLVKASGGEPGVVNEGVFKARFTNLLSAVLCARRIQWALHGLAQHENWRGTVAIILIHSGKPEARQNEIQSVILLNEMRGKILVEKSVSGPLDTLSAVVASRATETYLEVLWTDNLTDLDPEFLRSALRLSKPPEFAAVPASLADELIPAPEPVAAYELPPSLSGYDGPFGPDEETGKWKAFQSRNWLIVAGAGMLVVLLVILIIARAHKSDTQPSSTQSASLSPAPAQPGPAVSQPRTPAAAPPAGTKSTELPQTQAKPPKREPKTPKPPKPEENTAKAAKGSCDFSEAEIERSLKRADNNLHAGKFSEALQTYRQILDCPSARDRAQQGITSAKQKMSLQGMSEPNE